MGEEKSNRLHMLGLLFLVYVVQMMDRSVFNAVLEPVRLEFHLSDKQLGLLAGLVYTIPFVLTGIPMGVLIDRVHRIRLLWILISVWSVFTATTGLARSFGTLLLARAAVGASEAGAPPTILSLVADLFDRKSRPFAISVIYVGPPIGVFVGSALAGWIGGHFGWRWAMFGAFVPGVIIALLVALSLREPQRGAADSAAETGQPAEPFGGAIAFLVRDDYLLRMFFAIIFAAVVSIGVATWMTALLMRVHGLPLPKAGPATGMATGLVAGIGSILGGFLAQQFGAGRSDRLRQICAASTGFAMPFGIAGALAGSPATAIACFSVWGFINAMYMGAGNSLFIAGVPARMRGTLLAILLAACNLLGAGLGPQFVGILSDGLMAAGDMHALSHATAALVVLGIVPTLLFFGRRASSQAVSTAA